MHAKRWAGAHRLAARARLQAVEVSGGLPVQEREPVIADDPQAAPVAAVANRHCCLQCMRRASSSLPKVTGTPSCERAMRSRWCAHAHLPGCLQTDTLSPCASPALLAPMLLYLNDCSPVCLHRLQIAMDLWEVKLQAVALQGPGLCSATRRSTVRAGPLQAPVTVPCLLLLSTGGVQLTIWSTACCCHPDRRHCDLLE